MNHRNNAHPRNHRNLHGLTLLETITATTSIGLILAMLIPALGAVNDDFRVAVSLNNLRVLGTMHVAYANDWDGRQWTMTPDNLTEITGGSYPSDYEADAEDVPPAILGFDCEGTYHVSWLGKHIQQSWYASNCSLGTFRYWNTQAFTSYAK